MKYQIQKTFTLLDMNEHIIEHNETKDPIIFDNFADVWGALADEAFKDFKKAQEIDQYAEMNGFSKHVLIKYNLAKPYKGKVEAKLEIKEVQ